MALAQNMTLGHMTPALGGREGREGLKRWRCSFPQQSSSSWQRLQSIERVRIALCPCSSSTPTSALPQPVESLTPCKPLHDRPRVMAGLRVSLGAHCLEAVDRASQVRSGVRHESSPLVVLSFCAP